jgi:ATP-binding cassette, subfamily B, bacterial HlyB/CyaB
MNFSVKFPAQSEIPEPFAIVQSLLLLTQQKTSDEAYKTFTELSRSLEVKEFQLGDEICSYIPVDIPANSAQNEQNQLTYLVCQGKVRLLSWQADSQREVSIQVLEVGQSFGADEQFGAAASYRVVAASAAQVVCFSGAEAARWGDQVPALQSALQTQTHQRQRLIFFKALTTLTTGSDRITSDRLQQLLPLLIERRVPAGTALKPEENAGYSWLRQGEIRSITSPTPAVGSGWLTATPDWVAQTDLLIEELPSAQWEAAVAIVPDLATSLGLTANSGPGMPLDRGTKTARRAKATRQDRSPTPEPTPKSGTVVDFPRPTRSRRWHLRLLPGYPFIQQQSSSDCGVTCLAMIGQYWGKRLSLNQLREQAKVGRSGAALKNLAIAADQVGFQARPVRGSLGRLAEQRHPWIAHWQGDHYVVVYRIRGDRAVIADPARGKRTLSRQEFLTHWSGYALLLDPTPQLHATATEKRDLGQFWSVFWTYRQVLWQIIGLSLLLQVFGLVTPLFTQLILDKVVTQKSLPTLHVFSIGLLLFGLWRVGLVAVRQYLLDYFSNRLDLTMVSAFVGHTLRLPLKFFESRQVGDILTRVQENQKIQAFLMRQAISTWLDTLMGVVYLGLMLYYNWRLTLLALALIPPIVILTLIATPLMRKISREVFTAAAEQNSLLVEMLTGVNTVKATATEREVRWRWEDRLTSLLNVQFKGQRLGIGLQAISGAINSLGSTAMLWYGATLVIQGELTIGQFVAFNMLIGNVIGPILALVGLWDEFQEVLISVERLNDVFAAQPEESPSQPMLVMPAIQGEIRFDDVTFHYEQAENHNTLQNLTFTIAQGETIAIVGRSGSGKSTLVKLLQALYYPTSGRILLDGHDTKHVSPHSLRSQLGIVPQECFLFSGTILENIQLYRPEYTLEQVIEVAKLAEAHPFIQDLPLGYNTKVGERGCNLSGGQRQRIAIARALLGNPAMLILDEATSSLDTESERRFQHNLEQICRGRTTLMIAHRLSTVRHADRILVLDRGILAEQGTHTELITQPGLYYHLAQQQLDL